MRSSLIMPASESDRLDSPRGWRTIAAGVVTLWLGPSILLVMCFGIFVQAWQQSFGWPASKIALGGSIIAVMIMFVAPIQGWLADRIGPRRLALIFLPVWAAGLALMAELPANLIAFYAACALLPIFGLGLWPIVHMKLASNWFERRLGLAVGLTNAGMGLSVIFLPLILRPIITGPGWRASFLMLAAAVVLIVFPVAFFWLRERSPVIGREAASPLEGLDLSEALKTKSYCLALGVYVLLGLLSGGLLINFSSIYVEAGGTFAMAVTAQSALGIGTVAGRVLIGWLLDHVQVRPIGIAVCLIAAAACLSLASPFALQLGIIAAMMIGILLGAEFDILGVLIRRYLGIRAFGQLYGVVYSVFQLGSAAGVASLAFSKQLMGSYIPGLGVLVGASILGGLLFFVMPAYRYPPVSAAGRAPVPAGADGLAGSAAT